MRVVRSYGRKVRIANRIAAGDSARSRGQWRLAASAYHDALLLNPNLSDIWVQYGHALKEQGHLIAAEHAYRRSIAINHEVADTHLQLGHALKLQHRMEEAADSYLTALKIDRELLDGWEELLNLRWTTERIWASLGEPAILSAHSLSSQACIALDASDLFYYFINEGPILTGIQRVQGRMICGLYEHLDQSGSPLLLCFVMARREWVRIPLSLYRNLYRSTADRSAWNLSIKALKFLLLTAPSHEFQDHTSLINLGTSWWLPDYLLRVRTVRRTAKIRFYHFIHDVIPAIRPEYFQPELSQDFLPWIVELLTIADGVFVNSTATKSDLEQIADAIQISLPPIEIISLNGPHSYEVDDLQQTSRCRSLEQIGIDGKFVLFVSTLEYRKNHALAFDAWKTLAKEYGKRQIPDLICVGRRGWLFEEAAQALSSDETLREYVHLLDDVTDTELELLYRACLFTIYPSAYEGWGLPVSEALYYGKVALVAKTSSLPEAGGPFVEYFDLADVSDFKRRLRRLLDSPEYLEQRQKVIAARYKSRSWQLIAAQLFKSVDRWNKAPPAIEPTILPTDLYLPMARNRQVKLVDLVWSSAVARVGRGWEPLDDIGCYISGDTAKLELASTKERYLLYMVVENVSEFPVPITIMNQESGSWTSNLSPRQRSCIKLLIEDRLCRLRISVTGQAREQKNPVRRHTVRVLGLFACDEHDEHRRLAFLEAFAIGEAGLQANCAKRLVQGPARNVFRKSEEILVECPTDGN